MVFWSKFIVSSSGQMGMKNLHRNLLQGVCLWSLLAVQVSSCPDSCSLCSGPENDQCEECRAGWTLHNKICTSMSVAHSWVTVLQTVTALIQKDPLSAEAVTWPVWAAWVADQHAAGNVLLGTD